MEGDELAIEIGTLLPRPADNSGMALSWYQIAAAILDDFDGC